MRELLLHLRPQIRDLYGSYGIPREIGTAYLREAAELAVLLCHRLHDPRGYFLDRLEVRCRAYWRAVMALEDDLDHPAEGGGGQPER